MDRAFDRSARSDRIILLDTLSVAVPGTGCECNS